MLICFLGLYSHLLLPGLPVLGCVLLLLSVPRLPQLTAAPYSLAFNYLIPFLYMVTLGLLQLPIHPSLSSLLF